MMSFPANHKAACSPSPAGCSWSPGGLPPLFQARWQARWSAASQTNSSAGSGDCRACFCRYFSSFRNLTSIPFHHLLLPHLPAFPCFHGLRRDWFLSALVPLITYLNPTLPQTTALSVSPSLVISGLVVQTESRVSLQSSFPLSPFT